MIDHYDWAGGREAMLRFGPADGPVVIAALPLFEEANRTRTFTVTILRALAGHGIASVLPDMPGQGESAADIADLTLRDLVTAMAAATGRLAGEARRTYALGIRSGALLDVSASHHGRWHLSPQAGREVLRDLHRLWLAGGGKGSVDDMALRDDRVEIAGTVVSRDLLRGFDAAEPVAEPGIPRRIARLASDPGDADVKFDGAALWRRAEPGNDPALAAQIAADVAAWVRQCEG